MKNIVILLITVLSISIYACSQNKKGTNEEVITNTEMNEAGLIAPNLSTRVQEVTGQILPGLQSVAGARIGDQLLALTGRKEGFHGFIEPDTIFKASKANDRVWAINFETLNYNSTSLNPASPYYLQMMSSNTEYCQDQDTLYVVGGFGRATTSDIQSNKTFGRLIAFHVPTLLNIILSNGDPDGAILYSIESDFLKVTGGEFHKEDGYYYLIGGQQFNQKYQVGYTGEYTNAVKSFRIQNGIITDTSSNVKSFLHRRDFNVEKVYSSDKALYVGYGGVFTEDDNGFQNPVYIYPQGDATAVFENRDLFQLSNQYNAAVMSVMDVVNNINTHFIYGGIGKYQYDQNSGKWVEGDNGAVLPYVKTIAKMTWSGNELDISNQIPPQEAELPTYLGTNALFFPLSKYCLEDNVIDLSKMTPGDNMVGYLFGGIASPAPTANSIYPTTVNKKVYEVYLNVSY